MGLPNAGKSSLLARITRAQPKVADYPVHHASSPCSARSSGTTASSWWRTSPGLIEGASAGAGLGHEFLAHVERCRLLVHVLDLQPLDGSDPVENFETVEAELREHGHGLAGLPRILALSKADLVPPEQAAEAAELWTRRLNLDVFATSAATGEGLDELAGAIFRHVPPERREEAPAETPATHRVYRPGRGDAFSVERTGPGRVPRGGRARGAADRAARRGQRGGAPLRRGAPARARA